MCLCFSLEHSSSINVDDTKKNEKGHKSIKMVNTVIIIICNNNNKKKKKKKERQKKEEKINSEKITLSCFCLPGVAGSIYRFPGLSSEAVNQGPVSV